MRHATAGSRFYIGTPLFSEPDQAGYEGGSYTEVRDVSDVGEIGLSAEQVEFTPISGHRRRTKGTPDYGEMEIICHRNAEDPGQQAMLDAAKNRYDYSFKIELTDVPAVGGTPSVYYFMGEVMSARNSLGEANSPVTVTFRVAVNTEPLLVAPAS